MDPVRNKKRRTIRFEQIIVVTHKKKIERERGDSKHENQTKSFEMDVVTLDSIDFEAVKTLLEQRTLPKSKNRFF